MKVIERVVLDMETMTVLEEDSHEYSGPVALCKGGSGGSTTTVDKEYNNRMATLSEEQQDWAREYFNFWKSDYKPVESAMLEANKAEIAQKKPVQEAFYRQSLEGADPAARAMQAGADVTHSFANANEQMVRGASRMGLDPTSGKFASAMTGMTTDQAAKRAGAMTMGRRTGEDDQYKRLATAMGMTKGE
ncbi:hypothetical protein [Pseudodesulfovibrio tunisiensis]|uniref:hypothetical protein n=1 Tax=Pseudodesulfovibrio tunisiensis TaxID=463192 RepID=UPI001FB4FAA3|nr:hypothetical protein [Pseudodesulfovibrio tunisiensis]